MGGIKKALSPLHAMYSYTDASVWLINSLYVPADNIHVYASIYTLNGTLLSSKDKGNIAIDADGTMNLFSLPMNENGFFFIHLRTVNSTTGNVKMQCTVINSSNAIAFFIHLRMLRDDGSVIAPILWDDNMFTLLPQTQKSISVTFATQSQNYQ